MITRKSRPSEKQSSIYILLLEYIPKVILPIETF